MRLGMEGAKAKHSKVGEALVQTPDYSPGSVSQLMLLDGMDITARFV